MMRKFLCMLTLLFFVAGAAAAEDFGRSYEEFEALYADSILFINENTGRHLLPLSATRDYDSSGKRLYRIQSGALDAEIHLDGSAQQIASCRITLTAPANMKYDSPQHRDFNTSGYHSYALMMALAEGSSALHRYALVTEVSEGLAASESGQYETNAGDYWLTCTRADGAATMLFENQMLMEEEEEILIPDEAEGGEENTGEESAGEEDEFLG